MAWLISVIVPIYNIEDYVGECIESIINQEYKNLDIILVDDGSTDSSGAICDEYALVDNRIRVVHKENGGHTSARKAGIDIAQGDYITFVDGDDWLDLDAYKTVISKIGEYNPEMIAFGYKKIFDNKIWYVNEWLEETYYTKSDIKAIIERYYNESDVAINIVIRSSLCCKLFKPTIIRRNLTKIDNRIVNGEDVATTVSCLIETESIFILHDTLYNYRVRNTSISHTHTGKEITSIKLIAERLRVVLTENGFLKNKSFEMLVLSYLFLMILLTDISCFFHSLNELFPKLNVNHKLIIYGSDIYGMNLRKFIEEKSSNYVVDMIDTTTIDKLNDLSSDSYDCIVIAIANSRSVISVKNNLIKLGIPENKIIYLENKNLNKDSLYRSLGV